MYCENCGAKIPDGAKYCDSCGAPVVVKEDITEEPSDKKKVKKKDSKDRLEGKKVTENIYLCPDGKYRWYYEFDMMRNPAILITVFKVLGLSALIVFVLVALINLIDGNGILPSDPGEIKVIVYVILAFVVITLLAYTILAAAYGWKYLVLFEMDEEKVIHMQLPKQFEKAKAIGWLTVMAGGAAGSLTASGIGMNVLNKNKSVSTYKNVKKVKSVKQFDVIHVSEGLERNQVYAEDADYDFVMDYISQRCENARVYR